MAVTKELDTPTQMTIHLATEATAEDKDNVQKTIYKTKSSDSFDDKVKALSGSLKVDLALTYAFLLDSNIDDSRVAKLTQPGLLKMIALRLTQLMPQRCFPCRDQLFYFKRGEAPLVECRRCKRGACPECYSQEAVRHLTNFRYLCKECDEIVHDDMGEGRLMAADFDKAWAKRNPEKNGAEENKTTEKEDEAPKNKDNAATVQNDKSPERPSQKDLFAESVEEIASDESEAEDEDTILQRQKNKKLLEKKRDEKKLKKKRRRMMQKQIKMKQFALI